MSETDRTMESSWETGKYVLNIVYTSGTLL